MTDPITLREHAKVEARMRLSRALRDCVHAEDVDLGERDLVSVVYARYYRMCAQGHVTKTEEG